MRVLVCGGAGFIGSHLIDALVEKGDQVLVIDNLSTGRLANLDDAKALTRRALSVVTLDVAALETTLAIEKFSPEIIFHLASKGGEFAALIDPAGHAQANIVTTLRLLEGARKVAAQRVIVALTPFVTVSEAGNEKQRRRRNKDESGTLHELITSTALDYCAYYRAHFGVEYVALTFSDVYGHRQNINAPTAFVPRFIDALINNESLVVDALGDEVRDFIYVDDVVEALCCAMSRGGGLVHNVGTGIATTLSTLAAQLAHRLSVESTISFSKQQETPLATRVLDPTRSILHLGWQPKVTLSVGLDHYLRTL